MEIRIPSQGKFSQPNKGEIFGNVFRTTNIDFKTNPGILRLSPRLTVNTKDNDSGISGMGIPMAFITFTENSTAQYWCACGIGTGSGTSGTGKMFFSSTATPNAVFANDVTASTPTNIHADFSDMVLWRRNLYVGTYTSPASQNIARLTSSWTTNYFTGTASGSFATQGSPKNMCVGFNGNLYICDDYKVIYVDTSDVAHTSGTGTIDASGLYRPIWIRSSSNRLWIGLMTMDASSGSQGYIAEWDGIGTAFNRIYKIDAPCPLSCAIKDDVPYVIDAFGRLLKYNSAGFSEIARLPVANLNIEMPGIYNDLTNMRWVHQRGMDLVDGKINILVNNFVSTGVYVKEMPSGIWEYNEDIGLIHKGAPCTASTDWGQQAIATSGALYGTKKSTGTLLAGLSYYTDDVTTQRCGIFYDDISVNTNKRGIIEHPFVLSSSVTDTFQSLTYRFRPITLGDKIKSKFRTMKSARLPFIASITWTSTSTFTSTDANFQYVAADNEVEIVMGAGASSTARISSISGTSTYTVTIDDPIGPVSGTGKAMITNYKETLATDFSDTTVSNFTTSIGDVETKIQLKTEFRGTGDFEIDDLTVESGKSM